MPSSTTTSTATVLVLAAAAAAIGGFCGASMVLSSLLTKSTKKKKDNKESTTTTASLLLNIIQQRRSIFPKQYSTKPVPRHIIEEMLEGARWAPTHKLTEPWEYIIYESIQSRKELGQFLADRYKESCIKAGKDFIQGKYNKKLSNAIKSSYVIAIVCCFDEQNKNKNPIVEEICSVAMSVQNMLLIASSYKIGAYWSSGSVHENSNDGSSLLVNPNATRNFLGWNNNNNKSSDDNNDSATTKLCLGWIFVGDYCGNEEESSSGDEGKKKWPEGRRKEINQQRISWK